MRKPATRRLSMQALESRNLLAGNIIGNLIGTTLALGGDAADNQLHVTEVAPNQIQVTGLTGTSINGAPSVLFAGQLIENVIIRTSSGDDTAVVENLSLSDTPNGNLLFFMSDGNDVVRMKNVTTTNSIRVHSGRQNDIVQGKSISTQGTLLVETDLGDDTVALYRAKARNIEVDLQQGNDHFSLYLGKSDNNISIDTGTENDTTRLAYVQAGNDINFVSGDGNDHFGSYVLRAGNDVNVATGDGFDNVHMNRTRANHDVNVFTGQESDRVHMNRTKASNHIVVDLGDGNDLAIITNAKAHDLYFAAAGGNDYVEMKNIYAIDDLHVKMGTGNDEFKIRNSSALNPAFDGGPGYDTIHNLPNLFDEIAASVNFEVFIP